MNKILCGAMGAFFISFPMQAKILVYPRIEDKDVVDDDRYKVYVREAGTDNAWRELQVFSVEVDADTRSRAAMAQFDADEPVEVRVEAPGQSVDGVKIRPLSRGILYNKVGGHTLTFRLERPAKLSVEFGGDRLGNLHLFANAVETETFDGTEGEGVVVWDGGSKDIFRKDCRLIYFGPGVHNPKDLPNGEIDIPSNCTVYLAPGALVKAKLRVDRAKNVRIVGRGMLFRPLRGVEITRSRNVHVEGVTVVNPRHYAILGGESRRVTVRNVKAFSSRGWSDGIDLMCCRDWLVDDVFLRTSDDCLAFYNHRWWFWGGTSDLTVRNSVLWADVAHAINVGGHGDDRSPKGETLRGVRFRDIDVLNVDEDEDNYRGVMAVCAGDKNRVEDVSFEDIRVEDCEEARLIDIRVVFNEKYNRAPGGPVRDLVFRNISYQGEGGKMYPMRIKGYDADHDVRGVLLENVVADGKKLTDTEGMEMNGFVSDVEVK